MKNRVRQLALRHAVQNSAYDQWAYACRMFDYWAMQPQY